VVIPGEPEVLDGDASIGADQLGDIVRVKHRSTDPRYAPPEYIISAISIGDRGSFVIMEGRLLREGAVLRTGGQQPRGWKLFRVSEAELFWQPLE
jgi:hypothetical protein